MFEVYFMNWMGRDEEAEAVFETLEEAENYIEEYEEEHMVDPDEGFIIHDVKANKWF